MEKLIKVKAHKRTILSNSGNGIYLNIPDVAFYVKVNENNFQLYFGVKIHDYIFPTNLHHNIIVDCGDWLYHIDKLDIDNIINSFWQSRFYIATANSVKLRYDCPIYSIVEDKIISIRDLSDDVFDKIVDDLGCNSNIILSYAIIRNNLNLVQFALEKGAKVNIEQIDTILHHWASLKITNDIMILLANELDINQLSKYDIVHGIGCLGPDYFDSALLLEKKGLINITSAIAGLLDYGCKCYHHEDLDKLNNVNELIYSIISDRYKNNRKYEDMRTLFFESIFYGNIDVLKYLLDNNYMLNMALDDIIFNYFDCFMWSYNTLCIFDYLISCGIITAEIYNILIIKLYLNIITSNPVINSFGLSNKFSNYSNKKIIECLSKVSFDETISNLFNNKYDLEKIKLSKYNRLLILSNYFNKNNLEFLIKE